MNISFSSFNTTFGKINRNLGTQRPILTGTDYSGYITNDETPRKQKTNETNIQAKQILVESYIPLALKKANEFSKQEPEIDANEIVQTAMLATVEAISSYKPKKEASLSEKVEEEITTALQLLKNNNDVNKDIISLQEIINK